MSDRTFYTTTPIYYPNGEPHLGSVYTTTICDVLARYHRLLGEPTYFLTGTDEHGTKMAKAAESAGVQPIEMATKYADLFRQVWGELRITNDDFIRTTEPRHKSAVQNIVRKLVESGDIYLGSYQGWYDEGQEEFVTETDAKSREFKSAISGKPLTRYAEPSYFFRLSKYAPKIIEHIESNPEFIVPVSRRNEVLSKLRAGVEDLSISRGSLKWGIPMPNDPAHVVYVWIDALTNYITALGYGSSDQSKFDQFWPATVQVIGKDILWFHTVYWPAMLLSLGIALPQTVAAHGWWIKKGGGKAGKTTGGLTGLPEIRELVSLYSLDALRYHLLRAAPFGSDLEWSQEEFDKSYNELANVVGNGLNRLKMVRQYRGGALPAVGEQTEADSALLAQVDKFPQELAAAYEGLQLQQAVLLPVELARAANGYIESMEPWKLAKDPSRATRLDTVLNLAAQAIHRVLVGLLPVLPEKAAEGLRHLGVSVEGKKLGDLINATLPAGHKLGEGQPLFPKVEKKPMPAS